jgi:hypothetical protein
MKAPVIMAPVISIAAILTALIVVVMRYRIIVMMEIVDHIIAIVIVIVIVVLVLVSVNK